MNLFKKKATDFEIAAWIMKGTSDARCNQEKWELFLDKKPEYKEIKNQLLDETQWLITACGVIAVYHNTQNLQTARNIMHQLLRVYSIIHKDNHYKTMFTEVFLRELYVKYATYLGCYYQGYDMSKFTTNDRIKRIHNGMVQIVNQARLYMTEDESLADKEYDELDNFIYQIVKEYMMHFGQKYLKYKIICDKNY